LWQEAIVVLPCVLVHSVNKGHCVVHTCLSVVNNALFSFLFQKGVV
jgi:hypothetical protein